MWKMIEWIPILMLITAGVILLITSAVMVNYYEKQEIDEDE